MLSDGFYALAVLYHNMFLRRFRMFSDSLVSAVSDMFPALLRPRANLSIDSKLSESSLE